jgi:hypothetical protein
MRCTRYDRTLPLGALGWAAAPRDPLDDSSRRGSARSTRGDRATLERPAAGPTLLPRGSYRADLPLDRLPRLTHSDPTSGGGLRRGLERALIFEHGQTEPEFKRLADRDEALARVEAPGARLAGGDEQAHDPEPATGRGARRVVEQLRRHTRPPTVGSTRRQPRPKAYLAGGVIPPATTRTACAPYSPRKRGRSIRFPPLRSACVGIAARSEQLRRVAEGDEAFVSDPERVA